MVGHDVLPEQLRTATPAMAANSRTQGPSRMMNNGLSDSLAVTTVPVPVDSRTGAPVSASNDDGKAAPKLPDEALDNNSFPDKGLIAVEARRSTEAAIITTSY